uniref:Uncharacterized protein n=1 Tax=Anguilla anguilla TaxID=7936 RepID=A0A0E9QMP3_ANGAN
MGYESSGVLVFLFIDLRLGCHNIPVVSCLSESSHYFTRNLWEPAHL